MKSWKVVGLDPSFTNFGIAIGEYDPGYGERNITRIDVVQTSPTKKKRGGKALDDLRRAQVIAAAVKSACVDAEIIASEIPAGSQSAKSSRALGIALGVVATAAPNVIPVTAGEAKSFLTGHKNASKEEMIDTAALVYPDLAWNTVTRDGEQVITASKNEHMADAIAVLLCGLEKYEATTSVILDAA